ncbi:YfcC family protein [Acinetobacter albensis]|uniref:Uncharacterized membrane protein YfcC, ion transporter superfamily n=1 Tax=Acinetobacter albensis TaxID=1673609 RepID=A0A1C4GUA5_9GAMM|nr:AbgT family transporter [Acinetobacter albensis]SCC71760.1 Uncharacterized membrane protein YfcC, ion transporter superfamily [Acinetobacter albensis]
MSGNAVIGKPINPIIVMSIVVFISLLATYFVNSGSFERDEKLVIPNSYHVIDKTVTLEKVLGINSTSNTDSSEQVKVLSLVDGLKAIPQGIAKKIDMILMILFIGGMFGVLTKSGAVESGLDRMLGLTGGNKWVLIPVLMGIFALGSTILGFAKEYLIVIPMVILLVKRLGMPDILGGAIVIIAVKIGYMGAVVIPAVLGIAQPLVGVPVFSGMSFRLASFIIFLLVGIAFVLYKARQAEISNTQFEPIVLDNKPLSKRHKMIWITLGLGVVFMVFASDHWSWKNIDLATYYLFLSIILGIVSHAKVDENIDAFISGMKHVLVAGLLIGFASSVEIILSESQVMDSVINGLVHLIGQHGPYVSAFGMFVSQAITDVLIPSTSGSVAVTMPILAPLGQLSGVPPQTTVQAFLYGHSLMNLVTPTSTGLLVLLAAAQIGWTSWIRFVFPLFFIFMAISIVLLMISVAIGV